MTKDANSVALIYDVIKESIAFQQSQKNSLETKASTLIAFAGGIFALLMGSRATLILLPRVSQLLLLVSVALFALSVVLCNVVTWVQRYRADPEPEALAKNYLQMPSDDTQLQLISNLIGTWKSNHITVERKASFLRFAFLSQALAFILLGVALFLSVR
jgi:hypothetical protein